MFSALLLLIFSVSLGSSNGVSSVENIPEKDFRVPSLEPKLRGVSLGGWLVLEPWITPSLFDGIESQFGEIPVDEYTFNEILGDSARDKLYQHWTTFYTERDFKEIAEYGLNLVRIPIGYWAFGLLGDDPYTQGQEQFLDQALNWAQRYGLAVQVDVHGMPGSQNGFDNSGRRGGSPQWLKTQESRDLTYKVTDYVLQKYGNHTQVSSIQMVNEPISDVLGRDVVRSYYQHVFEMAKKKNIQADLYFDDGFLAIEEWGDFLVEPNVVFSHHAYEVFVVDQLAASTEDNIANIFGKMQSLYHSPHRTIVGEFSGALTDCTRYLNGVGIGSRYTGTHPSSTRVFGSCDGHTNFETWTMKSRLDTKKFLYKQLQMYEVYGYGWIFWCYKTEDSIEWDFRRASTYGLLPKLNVAADFTMQSTVLPTQRSIEESGGVSLEFSFFIGFIAALCWIILTP